VFAALFHRLPLGVTGSSNILEDAPFKVAGRTEHHSWIANLQGDIWRQFHPFHDFQYREARAGRIPEWNPHIYLGHSFAANAQGGMFHPINWSHFAFDPAWTLGWLMALRLYLSALAAYALGRHLGFPPAAALITALAWALSGYNVRWLQWTCISTAVLSLPMLILALDRYLVRRTPRRFAIAVLAATWMQLAGHPESQFHLGVAAGIWCFGRIVNDAGSVLVGVRLVGECFAIMLLGLAGAAISLLPFALELRDSIDIRHDIHSMETPAPLRSLITFLSPDYFGRPRWLYQYKGDSNYNLIAGWIGLVPLALSLIGSWTALTGTDPRHRRLWRIVLLGHALILLAIFGGPGCRAVFESLPAFGITNVYYGSPGYLLFAAVFAGLAASRLTGAADPSDRRSLDRPTGSDAMSAANSLSSLPTRGFAALLASLALTRLILFFEGPFGALRKLNLGDPWPAVFHHRGVQDLGLTLIALAATTHVVHRVVRGRVPSVSLLSLLAALELGWHAFDQNPVGPAPLLRPDLPDDVRRELEGRRFLATDGALFPNLAVRFGLQDVRGYDWPAPLRIAAVHEKLGASLATHVFPAERIFPVVAERTATLLDRLGVERLLTDRPDEIRGFDARPPSWTRSPHAESAPSSMGFLWRNNAALPRAFVAERYLGASGTQAFERLTDPMRSPRLETLLEPAHAVDWSDRLDPQVAGLRSAGARARGMARIVHEEPNAVELEVEIITAEPAAVVFLDRMGAGWSVRVDGVPATPLTANFLFRGVLVPPGRHRVRWEYVTPGLRLGACLSGLTVLAALVIILKRDSPRIATRGLTPTRHSGHDEANAAPSIHGIPTDARC
jgi:hypothetical protein